MKQYSLVCAAMFATASIVASACVQAQGMRPVSISSADSARAYKLDAARHIYATYPDKIYQGKLPPLIHAVVVLEVALDDAGNVRDINTIRVPSHAPDVTVSVKDMIRRASPLPAPSHIGGTRFTEIWLVDKSGRFQLDSLTEGQR